MLPMHPRQANYFGVKSILRVCFRTATVRRRPDRGDSTGIFSSGDADANGITILALPDATQIVGRNPCSGTSTRMRT